MDRKKDPKWEDYQQAKEQIRRQEEVIEKQEKKNKEPLP